MAEEFFDAYGRCVPNLVDSRGIGRKRDVPNYLSRALNINYAERHDRYRQNLHATLTLPSLSEFAEQSSNIVSWLKEQTALAPLLRGIYLPLIIPKLVVTDYGCFFESVFLGAAIEAYRRQYPQQDVDQQLPPLGLDIQPHADGRHGQLLAAMAKRPLVGIFFPWAFHGIAPHACREVMTQLPPNMLLAGGIDTALALTGYPDVLVPNTLSPDLVTPGMQYRTDQRTIAFQHWGRGLRITDLHEIWEAGYDVTSGLLVIEGGDH